MIKLFVAAILLWLVGLTLLVALQTAPKQIKVPNQASIPEYAVSISPQQVKQEEESVKQDVTPIAPAFVTLSNAIGVKSDDIVPVRDRVIPQQASRGNKFNDVLGGDSAGLFQNLPAEVVVPSDYYHWPYLPTEFDGPYWPDGNTRPDYIYPGGPRPLRRQDLPAAYSLGRGA